MTEQAWVRMTCKVLILPIIITYDNKSYQTVFKVKGEELYPYRILLDGDGEQTKGMKVEWATVKDDLLYVGSTGKEWTTPDGVTHILPSSLFPLTSSLFPPL